MKFEIKFKKQDCWIGIFWNNDSQKETHIWICLIPCFPIHIIKAK